MNDYDSTADTLAHSRRVGELMSHIITALIERSYQHDLSKTQPPEKATFDRVTPRLRTLTYGTPQYDQALSEMGDALAHHYAHNRHHPEHSEPGLEWRPVKGFEGHYEVSNYGDLRSVDRIVQRDGTQGDLHIQGRWLRSQITAKGYLRVSLSQNKKPRNFMVHRLAAETFLPNPEAKSEVNHINGNKKDNRVVNLAWVTGSENLIHAYDTGLREPSVKYVVHCPELDLTTFGIEAMEKAVRERGYSRVRASGIWTAMDRNGKHFDLTFEGTLLAEYRRGRLNDMTLVDVVEMLADWKAASERHATGDVARSLDIQRHRFDLGDQLFAILRNTAVAFGWVGDDA